MCGCVFEKASVHLLYLPVCTRKRRVEGGGGVEEWGGGGLLLGNGGQRIVGGVGS